MSDNKLAIRGRIQIVLEQLQTSFFGLFSDCQYYERTHVPLSSARPVAAHLGQRGQPIAKPETPSHHAQKTKDI